VQNESRNMQLIDYVSVLKRHKVLVIIATLVVTCSALALSLSETAIYQGQARLLLTGDQSTFDSTQTRIDAGVISTEIQVIQSEPVRNEVRQRIGVAPPVSAIAIGTTAVIEVRGLSTKPARAALIANTYAQAYIDYRRQGAIDNLLATVGQIQAKVDSIQKEIDDLGNQIAALPPCPANSPDGCAERDSLQRERDTRIAQQVPFKQRLDQLQVDVSLKNGGAQLVSPAAPPKSPIRPNPVRNTLLGAAVGLIFGIALAFTFEHLDDSIKTKEDLERVTKDTAVLGLIPVVGTWKRGGEPFVVSVGDPSSSAAEAYRTLRTSIQFVSMNRPLKTLQVTSPSPSEGKSTTVANLAVTMANAGLRVIIVSCDLRRPRLHDFFDLDNEVGFTSILLGQSTLEMALQPVKDVESLRLLASGPEPSNPSELLSLPATGQLFRDLQEISDIVIVDCPPVLPVTDAAVISARMDGTLLVATARVTTRRQLSRTIEILRQVNAPLVGLVLNAVRSEGGYEPYYYRNYGNGSGYGTKKPRKTNGSTAEKAAMPVIER